MILVDGKESWRVWWRCRLRFLRGVFKEESEVVDEVGEYRKGDR